jgi:hypothetical protein
MTPLATYEEIDRLGTSELRLRQACQFCALFDEHHGESVDPLDTRFMWMCYADAFLMMIVSLKDFVTTDQQKALKNNDLFRMITVLRNVTVHRAVVSTASLRRCLRYILRRMPRANGRMRAGESPPRIVNKTLV